MEQNDFKTTQMDTPDERQRNLYFQPGDIIVGRYEFVRELGHGGMGRVFLCQDKEAKDRLMAVKTVPDILRDDNNAVAMLKHEYEIMFDLRHDGIVTVRNLVKDDFRYYVVMDYAEGETLEAYLMRTCKPDLSVTMEVAKQLAAALDHANGKGMVHRDVKPGNVMVQIDGNNVKSVKLLDFGLGLKIRESVSHVSGVMTSGTAAYKSPEQWRPDLYDEKLTRQSDQYSLAVLVYEMLAGNGRYPFYNYDLATFPNAVLNVLPKKLEDQPDYVNNALQKALAKKPEDRFKNCMAFVKAMETKSSKRRKWIWAVVVLVCVLALIAGMSTENGSSKNDSYGTEQTQPLSVTSYQQGEDRVVEMNGVKMTLKYVQAGTFTMGSPTTEKGREKDEIQHHVTLTKDYWLGETEVTQEQYKAVMGKNPSVFSKGGAYPVVNVLWTDAMAFCERLTKAERENGNLLEGYEYTLPTEAQWEYAARGGHKNSRYHVYSGSDEIHDVAWYYGNSRSSTNPAFTRPVGQKKANELGLYDMSGNVEEWCRDWYDAYPNGAVTDPAGPSDGMSRVSRGGAYLCDAKDCRPASRSSADQLFHDIDMGFRVALASKNETIKNEMIKNDSEESKAVQSLKFNSYQNEQDRVVDLNSTKMVLKHIKAGTFMMGSPTDECGRLYDETLHIVTLTRDFWLGKFPVTQGQWKAVMGTTLLDQANKAYPGKGDNYFTKIDDDYPMYWVNWNEASEFCRSLTERERSAGHLPVGYEYALPTEAQWEYACRGGTSTALYNGDIVILGERNAPALDGIAWYGGNSSVGYEGSGWNTNDWKEKQYPGGLAGPRKVGGKKANPWGIYDMIGNVYEWCNDWYGAYPSVAVSDPSGPSTGSDCVLRGGSWYSGAMYCRSAKRFGDDPLNRNSDRGFRVVLAPKNETIKSDSEKSKAVQNLKINSYKNGQDRVVDLNSTKMVLKHIKAGTFIMGSPPTEKDRNNNETQHRVTLTKDYWLGETEVTQEQYKAVMGNPSEFPKKDGAYPVYITWTDAMAFCERLTKAERENGNLPAGYEYTLPTEAQWEYAARGGNKRSRYRVYSGGDKINDVAWYEGNSNESQPVGQKRANELGLYDMSGNVLEWCRDWYDAYPNGAVTDPTGPADGDGLYGQYHVLRGGAWSWSAKACRSAFRMSNCNVGSSGFDHIGFRVALAPVQ